MVAALRWTNPPQQQLTSFVDSFDIEITRPTTIAEEVQDTGDRISGDQRRRWPVRPIHSDRARSVVTVSVAHHRSGEVGRAILMDSRDRDP